MRSIAVDRVLHVYGTPFFIAADLPIATEASNTKFRRLMIAQDTGSAIVGPARADIYFGAGEEAGRIAGRIKNPARFVMLMPRELDPVEAGRQMPLPAAAARKARAEGAASEAQPQAERRCRRQSRSPGRSRCRARGRSHEPATRRSRDEERTLWQHGHARDQAAEAAQGAKDRGRCNASG